MNRLIILLPAFLAASPAFALPPDASAGAADRGGLFFGHPPDSKKCRHTFIAAEPVMWDYAPSKKDEMCGVALPPSLLRDDHKAGKLRYVQYTDDTFTTRVIATPSLGILGPVLRGVVGEFLVVTFLNRTGQPLSMHPHGVKYDKDSEGASYGGTGAGKGAAISPGGQFTYVWHLDDASGPLPGEPSSKGWIYHSHVAGDEEINDGLIGFIIVTDPLRARPDGTPADVDRELATLFLIFDESGLAAEAKEAYEYVDNGSGIPAKPWADIQQLLEGGARSAINGRVFANLPGLEINEGERVRWHLFALGSERDFHTAHWHGQRVIEDGRRRTDVVELLPASMKTADFVADNPGTWMFHCHVADHLREGMYARFTVFARDTIGADRSPENAFLGLTHAQPSLRIARAEAAINLSPHPAVPCTITLEGNATVFDAFSVFTEPFRIKLGNKSVLLRPDTQGVAVAAGAKLRITNVSGHGVVHGGSLEFAIVLDGAEWLEELHRLGLSTSSGSARELSTPFSLAIGDAHHTATTRLRVNTTPH